MSAAARAVGAATASAGPHAAAGGTAGPSSRRRGRWPGPSVRLLADGRRLHLQQGPIDLIVEASGTPAEVDAAYRRAARAFEPVLEALVDELERLRRPLDRHARPWTPRGPVARRMLAATLPHAATFVTPMAAVAGAVADIVLEALTTGATLSRASVNNGGDIALHLAPGETFAVGLCTDPRTGERSGSVRIDAGEGIGGVATSGWRGRSHSLGIADAVTVLARSAAAADVAATLIANAVDLPDSDRVERLPARELSPDSDLGTRPVTIGVARLDAAERTRAIDGGVRAAEACRRAGLIDGAFIHLQRQSAVVGRRNVVLAAHTADAADPADTAPPRHTP